jgi:hypothetical protein
MLTFQTLTMAYSCTAQMDCAKKEIEKLLNGRELLEQLRARTADADVKLAIAFLGKWRNGVTWTSESPQC